MSIFFFLRRTAITILTTRRCKKNLSVRMTEGKTQDGLHTGGGKRDSSTDTLTQESFVTITDKRNKRDVWSVTVKPIKDAHFATFPEELITPCVLAGSRVGGIVLDPFFGSGTTGRVAVANGRHYLGIELNDEYIEISKKRTNNVQTSLFGMM